MTHLPELLIVDFRPVWDRLDILASNEELPTLDKDAIASSMIELLERPRLTEAGVHSAVQWLLTNNGLTQLHLEIEHVDEAEAFFYECLIMMSHDLQTLNPYLNGRLPYRYKERHGQNAAILEKYEPAS